MFRVGLVDNPAAATANLEHPGIVSVFEIRQHDGSHFFSMGFMEVKNIARLVRSGPLPPKQAAEITRKIAEATDYAHEHGVIHCDLKPANVLLDRSGAPKVTNFGLAKNLLPDSPMVSESVCYLISAGAFATLLASLVM
jgi:serine/threonine protein kinase